MIDLDPHAHRDRFKGEDVYVLGSGPTFNHLPPSFLRGKRLVATNHGSMLVVDSVDYLVTKYHRHAREYVQWWPQIPAVTTRWDLGGRGGDPMGDEGIIVLEHNVNLGDEWNASHWPGEGQFVATYSSITTAMHWAAHLGAANIILVGHDCGWIDGEGRIPHYRSQADGVPDADGDSGFWPAFDRQSRIVKAELQDRYGCNVVSLLPFINANMEGHHWHSFAGDING